MKRLAFLASVLFVGFCLNFSVVYAEVTQFSFITDPQNIPVGTESGTITIQSQNSSGASEDITETTDIVFSSTSQTGQFLSTSGNAVTTTMSKNTANKNFLYKDATAGTYTISITATGRTSLKVFTANQQITVGTNSIQENTSTSSAESIKTSTTQTSSFANNSAHSSPAPLSDTENKMEFEVSAGRSRLAMVGSQISFTAKPTRLQNISERSISYEWSFGDGTVEKGSVVSHSYNFPGDYSVVLNAYSSDNQAVSRTAVKVISPVFIINKVNDGIEVVNKTSYEINLEGWSLYGNGKNFTFPKDTIISAGNKVIFGDSVTGILSNDIKIINPKGKLFGEHVSIMPITTTSNIKPTSLDLPSVQKKIIEIKSEISKINPEIKKDTKVVNDELNTASSISTSSDQIANVVEVFKAPENKGVINSIFAWPIKGIDFVKNLFSKE